MQHALLLTLLFATSLAADPSTPADKTHPGRDLLFFTAPRATGTGGADVVPDRMTYTGTTQNVEYVLIASNKECGSGDDFLGTVPTVTQCAGLCALHTRCRNFVHGKTGTAAAGNCYWEHTTDACHTERLDADDKLSLIHI